MAAGPLEEFDFLYMRSRDVARDLAYYVDVIGAEIVFAIERFGTRVARVKFTDGGPALLLAQHMEEDQPVLVHRVAELESAIAELEARGAEIELRFGFPHGEGAELRTPGGQRLSVYERTRPEADEMLAGRMDFEPERG